MQTRRDQLQAYRFVTTRVQSALLHGEPDAAEMPMRRIGVAMFSGIMVAILVTAGFGVFGLLRPGGKEGWKAPNTLVVEKETGTRYVYIPADGALHPVLNYASARLILNTSTLTVTYFSRKSLAAAPRGLPRGIPGLPDSLPDRNGLITGPWTVCSQPVAAQPGQPATGTLTVSVGYPAAGQHVDTGHALVVTTNAGQYLVWNDHRLKIVSDSALDALHYNQTWALPVADTWVNSVPPGPDLHAFQVPGLGQPAPPVGSSARTVGQVYQVASAGGAPAQYWVSLGTGLSQTTETDALLMIGDPNTKLAYGGQSPSIIPISSFDVAQAARSRTSAITAGFPDAVPRQLNPSAGQAQVACSAYAATGGATTGVSVTLAETVPGGRAATSVPFGLNGGTASQVVLPPGTAALARSLPQDNQPTSALYLVTDSGGMYPVPSEDVLNVLGYGGAPLTPVPSGILSLIPTGPSLNPANANQETAVSSNSVNIPVPSQQGGGG